MLRFLSIAAVLLTAMPVFAETKEQRAERCGAQNAIVVKAIELRLARESEDKAKDIILADEGGIDAKYAASVPGMVGLIYSMKRRDVKELDASSFEKACLEYEP